MTAIGIAPPIGVKLTETSPALIEPPWASSSSTKQTSERAHFRRAHRPHRPPCHSPARTRHVTQGQAAPTWPRISRASLPNRGGPERPDLDCQCIDRRQADARADRTPLCAIVKGSVGRFRGHMGRLSGAVALPANLGPGPSSRPSMAVGLPHLQVVRPRFAAGAAPGPAASPTARWQRSRNGRLCPGHWQGQALGRWPRS